MADKKSRASDLIDSLRTTRVRHQPEAPIRKEQIDAMVNRFLGWKLPRTFSPDAGISFKPYHPQQTPDSPLWPVGTNLLTADEARAMFEHALGVAIPFEPSEAQISAALEAASFFDTPQSRKNMRNALLAAAGIVPPGQEWLWPKGIPGVQGSQAQQEEAQRK